MVSSFLSVWIRLHFELKQWNAAEKVFVFPHPTRTGIDRTISPRLRAFMVDRLGFPPGMRLHTVRSLCIAAMALEFKGNVRLLESLAVAMRHTLAVANTYYNHTYTWVRSIEAQEEMAKLDGEVFDLSRYYPQVDAFVGMPAEFPQSVTRMLTAAKLILDGDVDKATVAAHPFAGNPPAIVNAAQEFAEGDVSESDEEPNPPDSTHLGAEGDVPFEFE